MLHHRQHVAEMTLQRSLQTACWVLGQSHSSSSPVQDSGHTLNQNRQFYPIDILEPPDFHQTQALVSWPSHLSLDRLPRTVVTGSSSQTSLYNLPENGNRPCIAGFDSRLALDNDALPIEHPIRQFHCKHPRCSEWFVTRRQFQYALIPDICLLSQLTNLNKEPRYQQAPRVHVSGMWKGFSA
jgi:hypothetical protein